MKNEEHVSKFFIRTSNFALRWNVTCSETRTMPRLLAAALLLAAACSAPPRETHVPQPGANAEMKTIDSAEIRPAVMDPPPMLTEEAPPPKPKENVAQADAPQIGRAHV